MTSRSNQKGDLGLNLDNITTHIHIHTTRTDASPSFHQYQKLWNWPLEEQIDSSFTCLFCQAQLSPRSTVCITPKPIIRSSGSEPGSPIMTPTEKRVDYSCYSCSNQIRSSTSSPRKELIMTNNSPGTPRIKTIATKIDKLDEDEKKLIRRSRSSSLNQSWNSTKLEDDNEQSNDD